LFTFPKVFDIIIITNQKLEEPIMNNQFTVTELDMEEVASGYASISYNVEGYWSTDSIRVYVKRNHRFFSKEEKEGTWEVEVNYASGGYEDYDNIERARNFAAAFSDAVEKMEEFRGRTDEFEKLYKAKMDEYRRQRDEEWAEKEARIANDTALTKKEAIALINEAREVAKNTRVSNSATITAYELGDTHGPTIEVKYNKYTNRFQMYLYGNVHSFSKAIEDLMKCSIKSKVRKEQEAA